MWSAFQLNSPAILNTAAYRPEQKRRLAFYCVNVGTSSVDDLVRHHRIHFFAVDWPGMQKRRKANLPDVRRIIPSAAKRNWREL